MRSLVQVLPCLAFTATAYLAGCSSDSDDAKTAERSESQAASGAAGSGAKAGRGGAQAGRASDPSDADSGVPSGPEASDERPLVVITERASPEVSLQYLHVVADWPKSGKLDYGEGVELGEFVKVHAEHGSVFVYEPEAGEIAKYDVSDALEVTPGPVLSFARHGISGFSAEAFWVSPERAFVLDETSGKLAQFNPRTMEIEAVHPVDPDVLERDGLQVQFQQGVAAGGRLFTAVNWRDWKTYKTVPGVTLGIFDQAAPAEPPTLVSDRRCAPSIAISPFADADGNVYIVGDGGLGFDLLASPMKTSLPQCVLRVRPGETKFDPDFFVDVTRATGSPAFYTVHPMADRKLLVNMWSPEVDVKDVATPGDPSWYWEFPPHFEYAIVDLETGSSQRVPGLARAGVEFSATLRVDDQNFVQLYREDGGSSLHRVDPDGTTTQVLESPSGTDVQYLGRL